MADRTSAAFSDGRDPRTGRFGPGNGGKPKGTKHRVTRAAERLLERDATALTRKAVEMALEGDGAALKLCLDRLLPPKRPGDRHLDPIALPASPAEALDAILGAVAGGELLPAEGERLASLVKVKVELSALAEIEARLAALEERK